MLCCVLNYVVFPSIGKESNFRIAQYSSLVSDTFTTETYFQPGSKRLSEPTRNPHNENPQNRNPRLTKTLLCEIKIQISC